MAPGYPSAPPQVDGGRGEYRRVPTREWAGWRGCQGFSLFLPPSLLGYQPYWGHLLTPTLPEQPLLSWDQDSRGLKPPPALLYTLRAP